MRPYACYGKEIITMALTEEDTPERAQARQKIIREELGKTGLLEEIIANDPDAHSTDSIFHYYVEPGIQARLQQINRELDSILDKSEK